jgi:hypothetical protein
MLAKRSFGSGSGRLSFRIDRTRRVHSQTVVVVLAVTGRLDVSVKPDHRYVGRCRFLQLAGIPVKWKANYSVSGHVKVDENEKCKLKSKV